MPTLRTRLTVALLSAVTIALELVLIRALAMRFWAHYSYLIISTALLGFGCSGTALALARKLVLPRRREVLAGLAICLSLAIPLTVRLAELVPLNVQFFTRDWLAQAGNLALIELAFAGAMFLAGAAVGVALMDDPSRVAGHYAANLVGSGLGALGAVALLSMVTTAQAVTVLATGAYAAGLVLLPWRKAGAVVVCLVAGAALATGVALRPWHPSVSQYKALSLLQETQGFQTVHRASGPMGRLDVVAGEEVHYVPAGLSLRCPHEIPPQALLVLDGDGAGAVLRTGSRDEFAFMDYTTWALPYRLGPVRSVLILGAGGGADIGLARYHSGERVVAVEPNPQVRAAMTGPLRAIGGDIYAAEGVEVVARMPRGYLAGQREKFDLVALPFFDVSAAGEAASREAYLYTVEAFAQMISHLRRGGMINVACEANRPPRGGLRLLSTAAEALRRTGREPREHLAMIRALDTVNVTVFESPLSPGQAQAVRDFCKSRNFDLCFLPGMRSAEANIYHRLYDRPEGPPRAHYYDSAQAILADDADAFFDAYVFDVRPTRDDRPFFFHFLRPGAAAALMARGDASARGYLEVGHVLLVVALAQSVPLAVVLIVLPLLGRLGGLRDATGKLRSLAYFLLIGLAFMLVEMKFLHHLTLYLADPIYSAAVIIAAFLVFAGVGSRISGLWRAPPPVVIRLAGLLAAAIAAGYIFLLPPVLRATAAWPMSARVAMAAGMIAPLAMAMGHMFPVALRRLGSAAPALVPWCWAANGFASVVATVAVTLLAVETGFAVVAAVGAGAYLLAAMVRVK